MISLLGKTSMIDRFSAKNCKYGKITFLLKPKRKEFEWWCVGTSEKSKRNLYILLTPDCFDLPRVGRNYQHSIEIAGNII